MSTSAHSGVQRLESLVRETVPQLLAGVVRQLKFLLFPSADFAEQKFQDHRHFTAVVAVFLSLQMPILWIWDDITDPVGAVNTLGLRVLYLSGLLMTLGFMYGKNSRRRLAVLNVVVVLAGETLFVEILNRLEGGMVYGLAGFMYCLFLSILSFQCFSLAINIGFTLVVAALPHGLAVLGLAHGFPHQQYAALMWPASVLVILAQMAMAQHYMVRYELQRQLVVLSNTDSLTGVKNRRYFFDLLAREILRTQRLSQKLALFMIDIDHFKQVNDTYGHSTGDVVICQVTTICRQVLREIDVVARLGGEEFAVFLPGSDLQQATGVAERIRSLVEATAVQSLGAGTVHFTVSIGVAGFNPSDATELTWLGRADAALYAAKEAGRNKVVPSSC